MTTDPSSWRTLAWAMGLLAAALPSIAAGELTLTAGEHVALPDSKAGKGLIAPARIAEEDWKRARRLVNTEPLWKTWLQQEQERLRLWMSQPRDQEELVAGWPHDHIDARTGTFLPWTPSTPMPAASAPAKLRAAWVGISRRHQIDEIRAAARMHQLTHEQAWSDWASAQLDLLAHIYRAQPVQKRQGLSVMLGTTLEEAQAMPALIDAIRLLRPTASPDQMTRWDQHMVSPMVANLIASINAVNNIGIWQAAAIGMAGLEFNRPAWLRYAGDGPYSLTAQLQKGTSVDYFWLELSLGYQNVVSQALHEFLLTAALHGALPDYAALAWRAHNLLVSTATVRFTDEDAPTINDTNPLAKTPDEKVWGQVWRVLPTHSGLVWAASHPSWDTLLDDPQKNTTAAPSGDGLPVVKSALVPGLKSIQLRSDSWQAIMRIGQGERFHVHQDTLTTELKYGKHWLFRNAGVPAYGSTLHRQYYKLAPSHNTPLVDGQGVSNWFATPSDVLSESDRMSARMNTFSKRVSVTRELRVDDRALLDKLNFVPPDAGTHTYGSVYHTSCIVHLGQGESQAAATGFDTPGFQYIQALETQLASHRPSVTLECEGQRFGMQIISEQALRITSAVSPLVVAPRQRQSILISTAVPVNAAEITVQIIPLSSSP